jgi:signal transduction histidine kinase
VAAEVLDNLGEIIWAMNHENDTLDNLCAYLREYAAQSFELTSINGYIDFPATVPSHPISAEFRRHVFLLVKEGLHNIVKHSGAMDANLMLTLPDQHLTANHTDNTKESFAQTSSDISRGSRFASDRRLEILIADNGRGFAPDQVSQFGNGLQSMRQRVSQMNGTFDLQSQPGRGTQIKITVTL